MLVQRLYHEDDSTAELRIRADSLGDVPVLEDLARELSLRAEIHTEGTISAPPEPPPVIIDEG